MHRDADYADDGGGNDDSDLETTTQRPKIERSTRAASYTTNIDFDNSRTNTSFTDANDEPPAKQGRGRPKRKRETVRQATKNLADLPKIVGRNIGIFTNSGKMANSYFDIVFKNRNMNVSEPLKIADTKIKQEKVESDEEKPYTSGADNDDDDGYSADQMSEAESLGKPAKKRKRGRPKNTEATKKTRKDKRKKKDKDKKLERREKLRAELKQKMQEQPDKAVEFDGDLENLKFEADEFFDGEIPLYVSSSDKDDEDEDEDLENEQWECRHCKMKLRSHDLLLRHYTKLHGGYDWSSLCYYCGYFNGHKKMIYLHIKDHYAPKKREMKICDICCAEVLHLQQHQKAAHSGVFYDCTFCGKGFTRKAELNIHIKAVHLKHQLEQRFVCTYCNKDFPFMKYLKRHLRVHSNDVQVPHPYKCTACNAAFNNKSSLNAHAKTCPNRELLNRDLLPNQTGTVTPEPPPQAAQPTPQIQPPPQQPSTSHHRSRSNRNQHQQQAQQQQPQQQAPPSQQPTQEEQQLLLQNFIPNSSGVSARDLISASNLRELQIGLALPSNAARDIQIANTARELQLATTRELQLSNITARDLQTLQNSARDLQNLQNAKFERPQMYYY